MKGFFQFLGLICLVVATAACAPRKSDQVDFALFEIEKIPTSVASVSRACVYQKGDNLIVSGTLRRTHEVKVPGHIDVVICGPEGLIEKQSVSVPGLSSKKKGALNLPFNAQFNVVPPVGSKVILRYHAPASEPLDQSICAISSKSGPEKNGLVHLAKLTFPRPRGS